MFVYSFVKEKRALIGLEFDITVCGKEELSNTTDFAQVYRFNVTKNDRPMVISTKKIIEFFKFSFDERLSSEKCDSNFVSLYNNE